LPGAYVMPTSRALVRYAELPLAVGLLAQTGVGELLGIRDAWIFSLGILLAAPSAIKALTVSRISGGVELPTGLMIFLSTAISPDFSPAGEKSGLHGKRADP